VYALAPETFMPDRRTVRDQFLARVLGLSWEQVQLIPEEIREFGITLLLDGGGDR
jgi:hypothetical protein